MPGTNDFQGFAIGGDQFIDIKIRLEPVAVGSFGEVGALLDFYMGRNTPERRDFIIDNLATDVM